MLLTRAPVAGKGIATSPLPLDLHVLGLSLAFILSQDQTLHGKSYFTEIFSGRVMCMNLDSRRFSIHARYVLFISIS